MLSSKWLWHLTRATHRMDVRALAISLLAVVAAPVALILGRYVSPELADMLGSNAVGNLLTIVASSMLTITTFSLSTIVAAFATSSTSTSPRATALLMQNATTQNMLSTFVGAFIFSLTGLILLQTEIFDAAGRLALFAVTLVVIALVVITLLRWIDFLLRLGRIGYISGQVDSEATAAIANRIKEPYLGGMPLADGRDQIAASAWPVVSQETGYIVHIDMAALQECIGEERSIYLLALPGAMMHPRRVLARVTGPHDAELENAIRDAVSVASQRTYDQDPRFGLITLSEIASKALSPGINDPGTAIEVISRMTRILAMWAGEKRPEEVRFPNVYVPLLSNRDLMRDAFNPLSRDGAGLIEVQIRLQKSLAALAHLGDREVGEEARKLSAIALARAEAALVVDEERRLLRETVERAFAGEEPPLAEISFKHAVAE
ncbi:MAG: hypothetical protein RLZ98_1227 [Pseudomonadota bacterium]|jgi:uncharacterized membrane protein